MTAGLATSHVAFLCAERRQLNRVGDEGACALAEALLSNTRLQRMGLSANRLSPQVRRRCSSALGAREPQRHEVNLNHSACTTPLVSASPEQAADIECQALDPVRLALRTAGRLLSSLWRHLKTLRLLRQAAAAISWMLRSNGSLLALDLSCNDLGPAGAQDLLAALPHNRCAVSKIWHLCETNAGRTNACACQTCLAPAKD